MNILQITASHGHGGLERHVRDLLGALGERGHQVTLVGHPDWATDLPAGVVHYPLDLSRSRWDPRSLLGIRRAVSAIKPDIVHVHANKAAILTARALCGHRVRTVATVHGFKKSNRVFKRFDRLIAVSEALATHAGHDHTRVIYNGGSPLPASTNRSDMRASLGIDSEQCLLLAVGRLAPVKAYDILIRAWQGVNEPTHLVIAGDGPDYQPLSDLIGTLRLGRRVSLAGFRTDIPQLLAACDALVISSRREGFPYAMVDALLAGRPVLSTRVPGVVEWLPDECMVEAGDVAALTALVNLQLADRNRLQAVFAPIWERAGRELTVTAMADATERVYLELLKN